MLAINSDYKRSLLEGLELFRGVHAEDILELLQNCTRRDLEKGELLLSPGATNESVFVVLSGRLNVYVGSPDTPVLATVDVGECVGGRAVDGPHVYRPARSVSNSSGDDSARSSLGCRCRGMSNTRCERRSSAGVSI